MKCDAAVAASLIGWFETTILFPLKAYGTFCPKGENFTSEDSHHLKEKVVFRILVIDIIGCNYSNHNSYETHYPKKWIPSIYPGSML